MALVTELGLTASPSYLNTIVWALFNATKDQSVKTRVFGIPISVKVEVLRPIIERWVGPEVSA